MCYLHLPTLGAGAFCCDFTRALFLTTCATKSCCWDVLFGLVVLMAFLCTFLLHFNDEHHHTVLMAIASLTPLTEGRSARDIPKQPPAKKQKKTRCKLFTYKISYDIAASSNLWNKRCLPLRTFDMRALGIAN